jgi:hypothetical protein
MKKMAIKWSDLNDCKVMCLEMIQIMQYDVTKNSDTFISLYFI